ncbi:MAG TPA: protein kinase [Oligoflexia bacterium]|nr:protein kinase [Oligoflexia bacterium]HMP27950.1 protein kinase [Oligoflexia bacterium]
MQNLPPQPTLPCEVLAVAGHSLNPIPLPPSQQITGYTIEKIIGAGSSGEVYLASERVSGAIRYVAIKIASQENPNSGMRLIREASILAGLDQIKGVLFIYKSGETQTGRQYIVTPFATGGSLDSAIKQQFFSPTKLRDWRENKLLPIFEKIAEGLSELWEQKRIIHCDIKPANIFLDEKHTALLGDFGLAMVIPEPASSTKLKSIVGTPHYLAPEVSFNQTYSIKSDIWALGAAMLESLTGKPPLKELRDRELQMLCQKTIPHQYSPIHHFNQTDWEEIKNNLKSLKGGNNFKLLAQITLKCLHPEPDKRYQNYSELIKDLQKPKLPSRRQAFTILALAMIGSATAAATYTMLRENQRQKAIANKLLEKFTEDFRNALSLLARNQTAQGQQQINALKSTANSLPQELRIVKDFNLTKNLQENLLAVENQDGFRRNQPQFFGAAADIHYDELRAIVSETRRLFNNAINAPLILLKGKAYHPLSPTQKNNLAEIYYIQSCELIIREIFEKRKSSQAATPDNQNEIITKIKQLASQLKALSPEREFSALDLLINNLTLKNTAVSTQVKIETLPVSDAYLSGLIWLLITKPPEEALARRAFAAAYATNKNFVDAALGKATAEARLKLYFDVQTTLNELTPRLQNNQRYLSTAGSIYLQLAPSAGELGAQFNERAYQYFSAALKLEPLSKYYKLRLAEACFRLEKNEEAEEMLKELENDPKFKNAAENLRYRFP